MHDSVVAVNTGLPFFGHVRLFGHASEPQEEAAARRGRQEGRCMSMCECPYMCPREEGECHWQEKGKHRDGGKH